VRAQRGDGEIAALEVARIAGEGIADRGGLFAALLPSPHLESTTDVALVRSRHGAARRHPSKIPRSIYQDARDVARALAGTEAFEQSSRYRKRVEMLFAHLKRILKLGRLRLRGPRGAQDEFTLAAIAQNLRRLAKLAVKPPPTVALCLA
jgi:hypothetical protein